MLIFLFTALTALQAAFGEDGPMDQVFMDRAACLAGRVQSAAQDAAPGDACRRLTQRQRILVARMAQLFCDEPVRFCNRYHCLNEAAQREFVSPRCERPDAARDWGALPSEVLANDPRYHEAMVRAWGCEPPRRRVVRASSRPKFVMEYECRRSSMPFDCRASLPEVRRDNTSGDDDAGARARAQVALVMSGAELSRQSGGRCRIRVDDSGVTGIPSPSTGDLPLPPASGQDFADYRSGLGEGFRAAADSGMSAAAENAREAFGAAGELLGGGSEQFRLASRTILDEDRVSLLEKSFAAAKQGLESYLRSIGAPDAIIQRAMGTEMLDMRAFLRQPPRPASRGRPSDGEVMSRMELHCRDEGDTAFGTHNAFNAEHHNHPHGREIVVCPRYLLSAAMGNPRAILRTLLHELGHSIDPCRLSPFQGVEGARLGDCAAPAPGFRPAAADERERLDGFIGRVRDYAACATASGAIHGGAVRSRVPGLHDALTAGDPPCLANPCGLRAFVSPAPDPIPEGQSASQYGSLAYCPYRWTNLDEWLEGQGGRCEGALEYYRSNIEAEGLQREQSNETFADHVAAMAFTRANDSPHLADDCLSGLGIDEQRAEILTGLAPVCRQHGGPQDGACADEANMSAPLGEDAGCSNGESHADAYTRMSVAGSSPSIRAVLGCEGAPRSDRFRLASCGSRLCEGGACPPDSTFPFDPEGMPEASGSSCR